MTTGDDATQPMDATAPTTRPRRTARAWFRLVLVVLRAASIGLLLTLVVFGGVRVPAAVSPAPESPDAAYARVLARAASGQQCSFDGFDRSTSAGSALIRTAHGELRVVSFATGWDVYNGKRPGSLVAVCNEDRATTAQHLREARRVAASSAP